MIWLDFVLLVFISMYCSGTSDLCSEEFPEIEIDDDVRCIQEDTEQIENDKENATCELDSNVTMTIVDSQAGTLSVEFKLAPSSCKYRKYDVELYIEESIRDEESCEGLASINETLIFHSERVLDTYRNEVGKRKLPYCKDTEKLFFHHVYTGCYLLRIISDDDSCYVCKEPTFIETKYTKITLIDKIPNISSQYLQEGELAFVYTNMSALNVMSMKLHTRMCHSYPCNCGVGSAQHWWEIAFSLEGDFMCKAKRYENMNYSVQCHYDKSGDKMSCTIKNVTSGTYCVMMEIHDDRCELGTVWNKEDDHKCKFHTDFVNVTALSSIPVKEPSSAPVFDIVISVVAVLGLISLGVLLFLWLRGRPKPKLVFQPNIVTFSQQKHSIVLLYALDCKPFMTLMSVFRDILKEITKCKVYDCFDPERAEEIALNKTDWLRKRMEFSKIVLVENRCAVLHQKALLKQSRLIYKDTVSVSVDDLFMYGLKMLTDDCFGRSMYERVLVVQIEGFTETKDVLSYVAPLIRYAIPQHMEQLLSSLYQVESQHYENQIAALHLTSQSEYEMDNRMLKFVECLKNLENYKTEKPEYLNNMFVKESEPVNIM